MKTIPRYHTGKVSDVGAHGKPGKRISIYWRGYLLAIASVAMATWLKYLAQPDIIPANVPILYILAIVPIAIFFGIGPSILVCVLSILAFDYFFISPLYELSLFFDIRSGAFLAIFLLVGMIISYLASNLRQKIQVAFKEVAARKQSEAELLKYRNQLEELVKQRTAELEKVNIDLMEEIAERRKAEENLHIAMQSLTAHIENSPLAIIEFDPRYRITRWSSEAERLFGWTAEDVVGKAIGEFRWVVEEDIDSVDKVSSEMLNSQNPRNMYVNHNYRIDGSIIICEWYNSALIDEKGNLISVFSQVLDITQRKKAEEELKRYTAALEAANKELESFSYSVSHDLRTPLRTLDGFSEIVINDYCDKLDETGKEHLNRIRKASQAMSVLIDDMLKLSRITRVEMLRDEVNLSELTLSIFDELKATQPERRAEFVTISEVKVMGDRQLLQIAVRNLMENAWKFTGKCSHTRLEFGVKKEDGKRVYYVRDNGAGFDMQYADKLFKPFQRLHSSQDYAGTGIGLAIVQRVIQRHGGRVWTESVIGQGSTFYFTLS